MVLRIYMAHTFIPGLLQQGHQEADDRVNFGDEFVLGHLHVTNSHSQTEHWGQGHRGHLVEASQGNCKDRSLLPNKARTAGSDLNDQGTISIYVIFWAALQ